MSDETEAATPAEGLRRAAHRSRLGALWRRTAAAVRSSYLYRWLTAEPDPDMIVIDLRETWTVGPFIRLLDATLERLLPALDNSRVATVARIGTAYTLSAPAVVAGFALLMVGVLLALGSVAAGTLGTTRLGLAAVLVVAGAIATRERRSWADLRETRPVKLLVAALEPPAPPERTPADTEATAPGPDHSADENAAGTDTTDADRPKAEPPVDDRTRADP